MRRLGLLLAVALSGIAACGGGSGPTGEDAVSSLTFTREDGTTFTMPDLVVSCGESDGRLLIKANTADMSEEPAESRLIFFATLDDVADGATVELGQDDSENEAGAVLFVLDHETDNEVNSDQEDSRGRIVVHSAACKPEPQLDMSVDATLGSEYGDGEKVAVEGSVRLGG